MESFLVSVNAVVPIVIMAAIGYFLRAKKLVSAQSFGEMNRVCFKLFLPALLFYNTYTSEIGDLEDGSQLIAFLVIGVLLLFAVLTLMVPRFMKEPPRQGVMIQAVYRSNYVLLGMPIASAICGEGNLGLVAIAAAVIVPLFNFLAVVTLSTHGAHKQSFKTVLLNIAKNPLILSSFLGLALMLLSVPLPAFVLTTVRDLGRVATPLAIVVLGGSLVMEQVAHNRRALAMGVIAKLILAPAVGVPAAILCGFRGVALTSALITFAAPTAVSSFVMAQQLDCDGELAAELVLGTTVVSAFTMFGWIFLLSSAGLI